MTICLASNIKPPEQLEEGKTYSWGYIKDILKANEFYNKDAKRFSNINGDWQMVSQKERWLKPDNFNYVIYFET